MSDLLDEVRQKQYEKNHFVETALKFFKGQKRNALDNMIGMEMNIYCKEYLEQRGFTNIRFEEEVLDTKGKLITKADIVAEKNGRQYAFECKAGKYINSKCIKQIKGYKGAYKNVHLLICSDASIDYELLKAMKELGVKIVRADITKKELTNRVLRLVQ